MPAKGEPTTSLETMVCVGPENRSLLWRETQAPLYEREREFLFDMSGRTLRCPPRLTFALRDNPEQRDDMLRCIDEAAQANQMERIVLPVGKTMPEEVRSLLADHGYRPHRFKQHRLLVKSLARDSHHS